MIQLGVYLKNYKKEFPGVYCVASYLNGGKLSTESWAGSLECFGGESGISQSHRNFFFLFSFALSGDKVILCFPENKATLCFMAEWPGRRYGGLLVLYGHFIMIA